MGYVYQPSFSRQHHMNMTVQNEDTLLNPNSKNLFWYLCFSHYYKKGSHKQNHLGLVNIGNVMCLLSKTGFNKRQSTEPLN